MGANDEITGPAPTMGLRQVIEHYREAPRIDPAALQADLDAIMDGEV